LLGKVKTYISRVASWEGSRENIFGVVWKSVLLGKKTAPKKNQMSSSPKKKKGRLTVVQRWLTLGEKSDENMQPIKWTERRTGAPASAGQRKQLSFLNEPITVFVC
jgi:hypothetical protein